MGGICLITRRMGDALLLQCFQGTLSPDTTTRKAAENQLHAFSTEHGFLSTLLKISSQKDLPVDLRLIALVYLKNCLTRWVAETISDNPPQDAVKFSEEEQEMFKSNILSLMTEAEMNTMRKTYLEIFRVLSDAHFPRNWPTLISSLNKMLVSTSFEQMNTSLSCLVTLCRRFIAVWLEEEPRKVLLAIIVATFPQVFAVMRAVAPQCGPQANTLMSLCVKLFSISTRTYLPQVFITPDNIFPWLTLILEMFSKPVSESEQDTDLSENSTGSPWRVKKLCIKVLFRIYTHCSYEESETDPKIPLNNVFRNQFAIQVQDTIIKLMAGQQHCASQYPRTAALSVKFLHKSIEFASTYNSLKPNCQPLLQQVLFPLLSITPAEQEEFEDDPVNFVRSQFDIMEEYYSPRKNVEDFIADLFRYRSKKNMIPLMEFLVNRLNEYANAPPDQRNFREKYACLSTITCLSNELKHNQQFSQELESMIANHIFPEFTNPHGALRAKACSVFSSFSDITFTNREFFAQCMQRVFQCMVDEDLGVKLMAAIRLREVIANPLAKHIVQNNLETLFGIYIQLISEVDIGELLSALEFLIATYKEQIEPFASRLLQSFMISYQRICESDDDLPDTTAAYECLRAVKIVLNATGNSPERLREAEMIVLPHFQNQIDEDFEYLDDLIQIISTFATHSNTVSDQLWNFLPEISKACLEFALDYIAEILHCFDNLICADGEGFVKRDYIRYIIQIYELAMQEEVEPEYQQPACQLMECAIQNSEYQCVRYIPQILAITLQFLNRGTESFVSQTLALNNVGTCLFYCTDVTIKFLEENNCTTGFFQSWFSIFNKLKRVYDRKLAILGLSAIMSRPVDMWPAVMRNVSTLKNVVISCARLLHDNVEQRKRKGTAMETNSFNKSTHPISIPITPVAFEKEREEQERQSTSATACAAIGSAASLAQDQGYNSDEDVQHHSNYRLLANFVEDLTEEFEDEDTVITPIDDIEEIEFFFKVIEDLSSRESAMFRELMGNFTPEERELLDHLGQLRKALLVNTL